MKLFSRLAIVVTAAIVALAAIQPADAACGLPALITQNGTNGSYGYIESPGLSSVSSFQGTFWALGFGSPDVVPGHDNGTWPARFWLAPPDTRVYLSGDWGASPAIDGCASTPPVPQPGKTVVLLADTNADGSDGYFVAACATKNARGNYNFQDVHPFGLHSARIPRPIFVASARAGTALNLTLNHEAVVGGVQPGDCGATLIRGYRVYSQAVPRNAAAPASRDKAQWTALTTESAIGANSVASIDCSTDSDVYLATALVFDSGVETLYVSRNSTVVQCGQTLADPPGSFKLLKRPRTPLPTQ